LGGVGRVEWCAWFGLVLTASGGGGGRELHGAEEAGGWWGRRQADHGWIRALGVGG
jgi:hypothetical protein